MNFLNKNKKIIAAFAAGVIITSSIGYAANNYFAENIKYTKSGATNSITVETALNELYEMKDNKYTEQEYLNYGEENYLRGLADMNSMEADSTGTYTPTSLGKNTINCGFRPKLLIVTVVNLSTQTKTAIYYYNEYISNSEVNGCYYQNTSVSYLLNDDNLTGMHIHSINDTGFEFNFNHLDRSISWIAYR